MAIPPPAGATARGLWNRDFVLLWQGQLVSQIGNQAFLVALMYWTMEATGSASLMGLLMLSSLLPAVILGPLGGTLADRHSRKAIIVLADLLRGVATVALALLMFLRPARVDLLLAAMFAVTLAGGVLGAAFAPAIGAAIPDLVPPPRVAAANSLNQFSIQGTVLAGQAVGGVLYRLLGAPALVLADGLTYIVSAASEAFIRLPPPPAREPATLRGAFRRYLRETGDGLRHVRSRPGMLAFLLTAASFNFLAMPVFVLLPFYVADVLGREADWYGFLLAGMGGGSILGYLLAGTLRLTGRVRAAVILSSLLLAAGAVSALGLVRHAPAALAILAAAGACTGLVNIQLLTLFQVTTPAEMRGRVMSLVIALSAAASPLGMALGGAIGDLTGRNVPLIYTLAGAAMALLVVAAAPGRGLRRFLAWRGPGPATPPQTAG
jgi:MFS family permease